MEWPPEAERKKIVLSTFIEKDGIRPGFLLTAMWTRPTTEKSGQFELREVLHGQPPAYVQGKFREEKPGWSCCCCCVCVCVCVCVRVLRPAQLTDSVVSQIVRAAVAFLDISFHFLFHLHSVCKSRPPFFLARRTNALGLKR